MFWVTQTGDRRIVHKAFVKVHRSCKLLCVKPRQHKFTPVREHATQREKLDVCARGSDQFVLWLYFRLQEQVHVTVLNRIVRRTPGRTLLLLGRQQHPAKLNGSCGR